MNNSSDVYDFWGDSKKSNSYLNNSMQSGISRCTCGGIGSSSCPVHGGMGAQNQGLGGNNVQNTWGQPKDNLSGIQSQPNSLARPQASNIWQPKEETPQFNTTREAVGYFYDKQHPYGGMTKMTGPLGDINYYDENLYKQKEEEEKQKQATGYGQVSQVQPMGFANQEIEQKQNNSLLMFPPERKPRYAELGFDGQSLSWVENEEIKKAWPAMSGQPNYQNREFTNLQNKGPIPEGKWLVNQDQGQNFYKDQDMLSKALGVIGRGKWKWGTDAWGNNRIWINPAEGTDAQGRTNLSIHGGKNLGSSGCVDLSKNMDDFWEWYRKYGQNMNLNVNYPYKSW